ncbi:helix-turn-helix domain-containing protein [Paraburkholderia saeva]|uniref:HTH-type transcriptional activator RhaR n=1 Tax=Paraburkholderia saeva TaxID=2777537 RepID=A0A9N8RVL0_9BURK|nr:AraC family transcriptional regulator [Paraburkholderia saeva]CAG4886100.1 HTH-type transcriptional activator RhaR [Paraburkholderia saeva]CAG4893627.1 HTH-type transcriptional activator RhaR [Paraburkholderia saeva]CAG4908165.1 HTH-type transcriptional activator RhaR [Paraburkholderia saeva]
MKPQYERVTIPDGCSVRVYHRQLAQIPFEWHHHPEYELTLTMNSRGQRFIGDHIASYERDDLVLVPPDMPHTWSSAESIDARTPQVALVVWFSGDWVRRMADCCPEYAALRKLLRRGAPGLSFGAGCAAAMRARLPLLLDASSRARLAAVLDTLAELADTEDAMPLASPSAHIRANTSARTPAAGTASEAERLNRVFDLLDRRFNEPLRIAELCAVASLSERSLHRYFVRHVGESVGRYLIRLRLGYATRQLTETTWPIAMIATKAGFPNLANFNRQFLAARGMTPGAWRRFFEMHGRAPEPEAPVALDRRSPSLERPAKRG